MLLSSSSSSRVFLLIPFVKYNNNRCLIFKKGFNFGTGRTNTTTFATVTKTATKTTATKTTDTDTDTSNTTNTDTSSNTTNTTNTTSSKPISTATGEEQNTRIISNSEKDSPNEKKGILEWFKAKRQSRLDILQKRAEETVRETYSFNSSNPYEKNEIADTKLAIESARQALELSDQEKAKAAMLGRKQEYYKTGGGTLVTGGIAREGQPKQDVVMFYGEPKTRYYVESWMHAHEGIRNYTRENIMMYAGEKVKNAYSNMQVKSIDSNITIVGGMDDALAHTWESLGGRPKHLLKVNLSQHIVFNDIVSYRMTALFCVPFIIAPVFSLLYDYAFYESMVTTMVAGSVFYLCAMGSIQMVLYGLSRDSVNNARRQVVAALYYVVGLGCLCLPFDEISLWILALAYATFPRLDLYYIGQILPKTLSNCRRIVATVIITSIIIMLYLVPQALKALDRDMTTREEKIKRTYERALKLDERRNRVLAMVKEMRRDKLPQDS